MLDDKALDLLFREARSQNAYADVPISDDTLKALYDIWKYGPTSANCSPARVVFVRSEEGKAKLLPHLMGGNQEKTKSAAVCAIIGHDVKFYDRIPIRSWGLTCSYRQRRWRRQQNSSHSSSNSNSGLRNWCYLKSTPALRSLSHRSWIGR